MLRLAKGAQDQATSVIGISDPEIRTEPES
jgi:hypothetical protein